MTALVEPATGWERRRPGWMEVARKEMTDHLLSGRFIALLFILGLVAVGTVYGAAGGLQDSAQQSTDADLPAFLLLFTVNADPIPFSFMSFLVFMLPVVGIAYGFDSISGERSQGTLPRLVSQPIHRDDVINGKFVAGLAVIGVTLTVVVMIVAGVGIVALGVVPQASDVFRLLTWLIASVFYVGVWLAMAMLASVAFRNAATSAIVTIGVWLALLFFAQLIFTLAANIVSPVDAADPYTELSNARAEQMVSQVSPVVLYNEASTALLVPFTRSFQTLFTAAQADRAIPSELSFSQSVLLVWPQLVAMLAITVSLFSIAYVKFMRQEVRA